MVIAYLSMLTSNSQDRLVSAFVVLLCKMHVHAIIHVSFIFLVLHLLVSSSCSNAQDVRRSDFPHKFLFGTSVSAYQVEGGYLEDGKGLSNWDVFSHIPGNIKNNETGDIADDNYHRFVEDAYISRSLGVNAYRFSISWARILPRGRFGRVNRRGIEFYNKVINSLLVRGIEPFVTIHHFDHPQELGVRYGGWLSPLMQADFVRLAEICFKSFGDRVKYWATINEPNIFAEMGYVTGIYPPGRCSRPFGNCSAGNSDKEPFLVVHNMLLAHAKAVKLYRERFQRKQGGSIGIVVNTNMYEPLRDIISDLEAVNRLLAFKGAWIFDPVVFGDYPPEMRQYRRSELPRFSAEETECLKGSIDFIGINHYSTSYAKDCIHSPCPSGGDHFVKGFAHTTGERDGVLIGEPTGFERFYVVPRGMEKIVDYISKRYKNMPIYVTENGYSTPQAAPQAVPNLQQDDDRIEFHKAYLAALARAIRKGADVRGYFVWSLMDNFEWAGGYSTRFGLYQVDRATMKRTPKASARWFRHFLANKHIMIAGTEANATLLM